MIVVCPSTHGSDYRLQKDDIVVTSNFGIDRYPNAHFWSTIDATAMALVGHKVRYCQMYSTNQHSAGIIRKRHKRPSPMHCELGVFYAQKIFGFSAIHALYFAGLMRQDIRLVGFRGYPGEANNEMGKWIQHLVDMKPTIQFTCTDEPFYSVKAQNWKVV